MRQPARYRLRVRGQLGPQWSSWFEGLDVETVPGGDTTLSFDDSYLSSVGAAPDGHGSGTSSGSIGPHVTT
jgi:hypothetical protein